MFLKSIKVIFVSVAFSYQLVGMKPVDISRSAESEYPNLELQNHELINELQKKDEIIDLLRTELDETKQQLADVSDAFIDRVLELMEIEYIEYSGTPEALRLAIKGIISRNKEMLTPLWSRVLTENAKRDNLLPLPENLKDETIKRFVDGDE